MGGRGNSPYGKPGHLYVFKVIQKVDGKFYTEGEISSTGGSNPVSMFKEVGGGLFPNIQWFYRARGVSLFYHPDYKQYIWGVKTNTGHWGTNSFFNQQEWTVVVSIKYEIKDPNNHPIVSFD
jgi:hypothetical protein